MSGKNYVSWYKSKDCKVSWSIALHDIKWKRRALEASRDSSGLCPWRLPISDAIFDFFAAQAWMKQTIKKCLTQALIRTMSLTMTG